jgi:hypothetical protein
LPAASFKRDEPREGRQANCSPDEIQYGIGEHDLLLSVYFRTFGGDAQGTVARVTQIKVPIGNGLDCDVPVVVQVGNASSQPGVTIAIALCI